MLNINQEASIPTKSEPASSLLELSLYTRASSGRVTMESLGKVMAIETKQEDHKCCHDDCRAILASVSPSSEQIDIQIHGITYKNWTTGYCNTTMFVSESYKLLHQTETSNSTEEDLTLFRRLKTEAELTLLPGVNIRKLTDKTIK